jgi:hypothetical protein
MKKNKHIRNIDTLEKEVYRLKLEAKNIEEKLDKNLDHLQENYFSMTMNSFFGHRKHKEEPGSFFDSFVNSDGFRSAVNKVTDHIANNTAESLEKLVDKLFHKKN